MVILMEKATLSSVVRTLTGLNGHLRTRSRLTVVDVQAPPYTSFRVDTFEPTANLRRLDEAFSIKYPNGPNPCVKKRDGTAFHYPNGIYRSHIWMSPTLLTEHINYAAADGIAPVLIYEATHPPM